MYLPIKLIVYAFVARLGLNTFQPRAERVRWRTASAVALRAAIGIALVVPIMAGGGWLQSMRWQSQTALVVSAYLLFYLPLRWVAWSLIAPVVNSNARSVRAVIVPVDGTDAVWRAIGVLASCAVDLILIAMVGTVPIGKFFC